VDDARSSLLVSAYWKIPLQALVLLVGVLVFVFYLYEPPPLFFNPADQRRVLHADSSAYASTQARYQQALGMRTTAARQLAESTGSVTAQRAFMESDSTVAAVRASALSIAERVSGAPSKDVNYIVPHFVLTELPLGLAGLFIAAVLAAAMSAIAAELNSLATATVVDFYRRWVRPEGTDRHFLTVSRMATLFWGVFAMFVATFAATLGSLIEVVNRFGSFFYGSILGVFLLAMLPMARARGAFIGLIAGMAAVAAVNFGFPSVAFLWHNVVGAVTVVVVGLALSGTQSGVHSTATRNA
jgi:Na+/proline symporter